jgi:glycosyltransferase involved in cell wall biosynthesis
MPRMSSYARVVSITVTRRRAPVLRRLLESLARCGPPLAEAIVIGDGVDAETEAAVRRVDLVCRYFPVSEETGQGGGVAAGIRAALENPATTHCLLLDDDAVVPPESVAILVEEMGRHAAGCAVPLIENEDGRVGWFPGVTDPLRWRVLREPGLRRDVYLARCGETPVAFTWAPWPFLLVARHAVEAVGLPRADFGFGGDDLEWTMRLSASFPALLVPRARGQHWPPPRPRGPEAYDIDCLQLQNLGMLAMHLPHGRRARRHLPGSFWRFLRKWGARPGVVIDAARAKWHGVICGRPARDPRADEFWRRYVAHRR